MFMELTELNTVGNRVAIIVRDRLGYWKLTFQVDQSPDTGKYSAEGIVSDQWGHELHYVLSHEQVQRLLRLEEHESSQRLGLMFFGFARRLEERLS
jgi:hypothetical protein